MQLFFLVTFFENKNKIITRQGKTLLSSYPAVTVIVPCWNEEHTIAGTVKSLLALNYPQDKLNILLINDGSTDNTGKVIEEFAKYSNIKVFHKENGGKHTALNLGLTKTETEFVGCLDADSFADSESLARIMSYFENNPKTMAVAPSIIVSNAKTIIQNAQKAEYFMAVYIKKMLGFLGAIHVTPGPLTIFRKRVFDELGPYHHAHNTEDMEIAYRMQKNHYSIEQCNDAYIYTNTPSTVKKLYKQRVRWIYGFLNNTIDYKEVLFRKKYGNFAVFTVPAGIVSVLVASYLFLRILYRLGEYLYNKFIDYQTVGLQVNVKAFTFDPFFINTGTLLFITLVLYALVITSMVLGRRIAKEKSIFSFSMVYFFFIFSVIAPFWLMKALYSTAV
ncbi:MAG: glycosyltransferase, partial [Candidatus Nomurabacteria bacterium]|nr:glycosyltransferase [Candidatus Nomurabacteria bacterium]